MLRNTDMLKPNSFTAFVAALAIPGGVMGTASADVTEEVANDIPYAGDCHWFANERI